MCISVDMFLRTCGMIECLILKLDLGGRCKCKMRYVTQAGGQNQNVTFRYIGGGGQK